MAHDDRILSQDEIDSLLKKILPKSDKPAASNEPASVQAEPSKPGEAIPAGPALASVKRIEPSKLKEAASPSPAFVSVKPTEPPKTRTIETPPTLKHVAAANQELASDEISSLKKTVADLSREVGKLTVAMQTITQLEERIRQLEAMIKLTPDTNGILKNRIDKISNVLGTLMQKKSDSAFFEEFICSQCRSKGLLAIYVKCTSCGKENWIGWWPEENDK